METHITIHVRVLWLKNSVKLVKRKDAEDALENVFIEGEKINNVHSFVYLGNKQQCDGNNVTESQTQDEHRAGGVQWSLGVLERQTTSFFFEAQDESSGSMKNPYSWIRIMDTFRASADEN